MKDKGLQKQPEPQHGQQLRCVGQWNIVQARGLRERNRRSTGDWSWLTLQRGECSRSTTKLRRSALPSQYGQSANRSTTPASNALQWQAQRLRENLAVYVPLARNIGVIAATRCRSDKAIDMPVRGIRLYCLASDGVVQGEQTGRGGLGEQRLRIARLSQGSGR